MTVSNLGQGRLIGLSTDTKPTIYPAGTTFFEIDTGANYAYIGGNWVTYDFPSTKRIWGIRAGFNTLAANNAAAGVGTGLLSSVASANGTGSSTAFGTDSTTDGSRGNNTTGTNNVFARAGWWGVTGIPRKWNPTLTIRFRLVAAQTGSNGILYIGLVNQSAQPAAGTSVLSTYLDSKIGVLFGFRASDTTWMIMSNNNQATAVYTSLTSLPASGATDANGHTVSISLNDTIPNINWSFDGVPQTAITNTTNSVPPSATVLYPVFILEAQTATSLGIFERWTHLSIDAP